MSSLLALLDERPPRSQQLAFFEFLSPRSKGGTPAPPYSYYYGPGSLYWRLHHANPNLDRVREPEEGSTRENPDPVCPG
jgi:hypothetical protein